MATPTRSPNGVSTAAQGTVLWSLPAPDPTKLIGYFNDFLTFAAGDWTVSETTGGATQALGDGRGGWLVLTATASDNDTIELQQVKEGYTIQSGKKAWFKTRFKVSDATQSDLLLGLAILDTSLLVSVTTDGMWFRKDDGDAAIDFVVRIDNAEAVAATAIGTLVDDTFITLGYYYDGATTVFVYIDEVLVGSYTLTAAQLAALDDETLSISIAFMTGEAEAQVSTVDYVGAWTER